MAQVVIRNIDGRVIDRLKAHAAAQHKSSNSRCASC